MKVQKIETIPIAEIRIVNPRSRNRVTFQGITTSIATVGLKKPITVHRREPENDGTRYDLVCGQGRLESLRALGESTIPAIICTAPEGERYLMSLVENLARKQPSSKGLLTEVKRLTAERFKTASIARILGLDRSYIHGIVNLIQHGEEGLVAKVEAGFISIDIATKIAMGTDAELQRALSDAYEKGALRGAKLQTVQQLIARRKSTGKTQNDKRPITSRDLVIAYEQHTQQQRALARRSILVTQRLAIISSALRHLFKDDNFITLLRAEKLQSLPKNLEECVITH